MSRYIDLDEAKARVTQLVHGYEVEQWLDTIPSVDIDRPQGEWEMQEDADGLYGICSVCGQDADFSHYYKAYNYCPNCGAKMKGADDE